MRVSDLIPLLPKAELHLHIEGTLEPDLLFELAEKNQHPLPYANLAELRQAYQFDNLQHFLDLYYLGAGVLQKEQDFYLLMWQYLCRCREQNVVHCEVMFDPQTHLQRGIGFDVFMPGFARAITKAQVEWGQSVLLIMCFLRDLPEQSALDTLALAEPWRELICAVGLDSAELGNPPEKFTRVFAKAHAQGYHLVAHAGEEGPPSYIHGAIDSLQVQRIDHGIKVTQDMALLAELADSQLPLTVCPLSNIKLQVYQTMQQHPILKLLDAGLCVTVNADDPAYFGGYLNENFYPLEQALDMQPPQLFALVKNSFQASFLPDKQKLHWLSQLQQVWAEFGEDQQTLNDA